MANGSNAGVTLAAIRSNGAYFQLDNTTNSTEIKAVQKVLYLYGYYPGSTPDGYYGAGTVAAVKGFQNEKGLTADGMLGQSTLAKLEQWAGTIYGTPTAVPTLDQVRKGLDYYHSGDSGSPITTIRKLLNDKGYSCLSTGSFDSALTTVVKNFQRDMGLSSDGLVGQGTLAVLEDSVSDTGWVTTYGVVNLTAGKLARIGFTNILLRRDIVTSLNAALNTYGINTKMKVKQFLAQCMGETDNGHSLVEYSYRPGTTGSANYAPYYGAGMLQLTWKDHYTEYCSYKNDPKILNPAVYATQHVAIAYPADSAGWYWGRFRDLNNKVNWNDNAQNICSDLTYRITGSYAKADARYKLYTAISNVLK